MWSILKHTPDFIRQLLFLIDLEHEFLCFRLTMELVRKESLLISLDFSYSFIQLLV